MTVTDRLSLPLFPAIASRHIVRPIFKYHVLAAVLSWLILIVAQLHLSGYGLTVYLQSFPLTGFVQGIFGWLPAMNAYNVPVNCGLPVCGYPLTNILHGLAGGLIALTVSIAFATFQMGWYLFFTLLISMSVSIAWEYWEVLAHVTQCVPANFPTVQAACAEMLRIVLDQINDVRYFMIGAMIILTILFIVDRRQMEK